MRLIGLAVVLAIGLLGAPLAVAAQQKGARIGYLAADLRANAAWPEAFRQGLRELGYIEGQNILIEYRSADGELDRLPALAAELVRLKVHVLVSEGTPPSVAAKGATKTIDSCAWAASGAARMPVASPHTNVRRSIIR